MTELKQYIDGPGQVAFVPREVVREAVEEMEQWREKAADYLDRWGECERLLLERDKGRRRLESRITQLREELDAALAAKEET